MRFFSKLVVVACLAGVSAAPVWAQTLTPSDPGFWVTLPDGALVPYNHPLAAGRRAPAPRPTTPPPPSRVLSPADPGFWVTLADGSRVPYNHPLATGGVSVQAPAPAPSPTVPDTVLMPGDPGFWVTLPDGAVVPYNHPLALAQAPTPAPRPSTQPAPAPAAPQPAPAPDSDTTGLKVLDWNIHHGVGTDGDYDIDRIAAQIARTDAQVVSLNEVEKYTGWGNEDQPARFAALLRARTGRTWYYHFAQRDGNTNGQGNLLLSTFPIDDRDSHQLSYSRSAARIQIVVGGTRVNVFSTHLDADSSSRRATQMRELKAWAATFPEQRIIMGDFNAWPGAGEISNMTSGYDDAWAEAAQDGTAVAYSGNSAGNTRNSRIDYVWFSEGASGLRLRGARVFDVRDSSGIMPSDHRPVMATFAVQ